MKKLVDEKGRLFKKINLVDFILILLILIIIAAVAWKTISARLEANKPPVEEEEIVQAYENSPHLVYKVVCTDIPEEIAKVFRQQMKLPISDRQLMAAGKAVEGYVTDCRYEPANEDGNCRVFFTLEAIAYENEGIYTVGTQEVRLGKGHIVKTYNIETSGWVYEMDEPENEAEKAAQERAKKREEKRAGKGSGNE